MQTQPDKARLYAGPWDAVKKIYISNGIAGIYKGQVATLMREASGYGAYFWTYEKLMQREMSQKGIKRDQVNPAKAVLFGAASGYAVRFLVSISFPLPWFLTRDSFFLPPRRHRPLSDES